MTETPKKKCEKCGGKGLVSHEPRQMTAPDGTKTADPLDNQQWDLCAPCGGAGVVPDLPAGRKPAVQGGGSIVDTFNKPAAFDPVQSITLEEIDRAMDYGPLGLNDVATIARNPCISREDKAAAIEQILAAYIQECVSRCLEYSTTARADRPGRRADEDTIWNFGTTFAGEA